MAAESSALQGVLVQEIAGAHVVQHFENDKDVEVASGVLRVLMISVPLQDPFADSSKEGAASGKAKANDESDLWLALEVGPEFSLAVKSSQTVVPDRQTGSYVFPSADVPGAALRLRFDGNDKQALSELEDLLYDYCAFQNDEKKGQGSLELLDEKGALIGTIDGPWQLKEDDKMHVPGHEKDPVILELPDEQALSTGSSQQVNVTAAPRNEQGQLPAGYQNDWLLRGAHFVSRSMEKGSAWAGSGMLKIADSYVARSTPPRSASPSDPNFAAKVQDPSQAGTTAPLTGTAPSNTTTSGHQAITFSPTTHNTARSIHRASGKVSSISNRTTTAILGAASNLGSSIGKRTGIQQKVGTDGTLQQPTGVRGALNRSLVAFNVVLDGVTTSAERLMKDGGEASGRMIEHRYGSEAKVISGNVASVGRSAFVVYKDINGVRRKALLKIAVGTIKARGPDGSEVILQQEPLSGVDTANQSEKVAENAASTSVDPPPYNPDIKSGKSSASVAEKR